MDVDNKIVVLKLDEHDALRLLTLILRKTHQGHNPWRPYWKHLAQKIEQCIERSSYDSVHLVGNETDSRPSSQSG